MISLCHKSIARVARNTRFLIAGLLMGTTLVLGAEAN